MAKTVFVTEEEKEEMFERIGHVGKGFEHRLAQKLPISYQYTKPGEVPRYKKDLMVFNVEYESVSPDLSIVPKGNTKYRYWDRCRDLFQDNLIDKIMSDRGNGNTFLLYVRPRIEALTTGIFKMRLEGIWTEDKNVKQIDGPEEFEDPFPHE